MAMAFSGLAGLSSIGKFARDGVDYTSNVLGGFLFLRRFSLTPLLLLSLFASFFYFSFVCFLVPMPLLLVFSGSCPSWWLSGLLIN